MFAKKQIKMTKSEMDLVSYLLEKTGVYSKDCILYEDRIIFLLEKKDVKKVIGESGNKISILRKDLKKFIDIVAFSSDFSTFVKNVFYPVPVLDVKPKNSNINVFVKKNDLGRAIGRQGRNLSRINFIISRHFEGVKNIRINKAIEEHPPPSTN